MPEREALLLTFAIQHGARKAYSRACELVAAAAAEASPQSRARAAAALRGSQAPAWGPAFGPHWLLLKACELQASLRRSCEVADKLAAAAAEKARRAGLRCFADL